MIEIKLEPRVCECCCGTDLEPVWSNQGVVKRATATWLFPVNVAVCRQCGFCFASPGPAREDLKSYHADGLSGYKGIGLPYSLERRLSLLERYRVPSGAFAEVGGDQPGEFHRRCAGLFAKMINVEVSEDTPADYRSVEELPAESVEVLAQIKSLQSRVTELGERGKKVTLWGVTDLLRRLLENYQIPSTVIVVDSDQRRSTHLEREGVPVYQPKDYGEHIGKSDLLAIFAPRYKPEILEWVMRETGKVFSMAEVVVIGSGPGGETLT